MRTLDEHGQRAYEWTRRATLAGLEKMGIYRDSPRTKQLWRIARKAMNLYERAQQRHVDRMMARYAATLDTKAYKRLERAYLRHCKYFALHAALEHALEECGLKDIFEVHNDNT